MFLDPDYSSEPEKEVLLLNYRKAKKQIIKTKIYDCPKFFKEKGKEKKDCGCKGNAVLEYPCCGSLKTEIFPSGPMKKDSFEIGTLIFNASSMNRDKTNIPNADLELGSCIGIPAWPLDTSDSFRNLQLSFNIPSDFSDRNAETFVILHFVTKEEHPCEKGIVKIQLTALFANECETLSLPFTSVDIELGKVVSTADECTYHHYTAVFKINNCIKPSDLALFNFTRMPVKYEYENDIFVTGAEFIYKKC